MWGSRNRLDGGYSWSHPSAPSGPPRSRCWGPAGCPCRRPASQWRHQMGCRRCRCPHRPGLGFVSMPDPFLFVVPDFSDSQWNRVLVKTRKESFFPIINFFLLFVALFYNFSLAHFLLLSVRRWCRCRCWRWCRCRCRCHCRRWCRCRCWCRCFSKKKAPDKQPHEPRLNLFLSSTVLREMFHFTFSLGGENERKKLFVSLGHNGTKV